ncbi:MAG: phosphodiester glycosidase family protein [Parvularculaceae bacterium]
MMRLAALSVISSLWFAGAADAACRNKTLASGDFIICQFDPSKDDIRVFLKDDAGAPYGDFEAVNAKLAANGETLVFAMNAGMYHKDRSPVGLYVEDGAELKKLSTKDGPGNFHLKPNGVFWINVDGAARVTDTAAFSALFPSPQAAERKNVRHATQSGPMLVIDGAIHPKFLADATSRKRRNGVGVTRDGAVVFALADTPVTFHEFATAFRDHLKTPNALYLDGTISRLFAPELDRNDGGLAMGPIVGVVKKADQTP